VKKKEEKKEKYFLCLKSKENSVWLFGVFSSYEKRHWLPLLVGSWFLLSGILLRKALSLGCRCLYGLGLSFTISEGAASAVSAPFPSSHALCWSEIRDAIKSLESILLG